MSESILLKTDPKIEFHFQADGFQLNDDQTENHSGFYAYGDLESVELNRVWFPKLSVWMRVITTFLNGVPYFPDADAYKYSSMIIRSESSKIGIWLTDMKMAKQARMLKEVLDQKTQPTV